jgi:tripartite-type tricarboxylate transporter receptor subunit TctC
MAESLRNILGATIVVENTTGAGGTIGVGRVARSAPDGYTIGIGQWGTNVASGAIYPLQFDLVKDFEPVGLISTQPFLVVARKTMPADNLKDLIAWLKANQDKASQGNSGVGTPSHVGGLMFQNAIGAKYTMIPYRGAGQSMQGLVSEQLDVMLDTPAVSLPQIQGGTIKAYAVTAKSRIPVAPDIPTTDEAGLPGFHFSFWHAFWVPKDTPKDIVAKLNDALVKTLADPVTRDRLTKIAQEIFPRDQQTPEALATFHQAEIDKWWPIIKEAGIKPQ